MKLFAFDLDGTLIHRKESGERFIPPELLQSVESLSRKHSVIIATGRRYRAALEAIELLPPMNFAIVHNGLLIKNHTHDTVFSAPLDYPVIREISRTLNKLKLDHFFVLDGYDKQKDFAFFRDRLHPEAPSQIYFNKVEDFVHLIDDDEEASFSSYPVLEIAAIAPYEELSKKRAQIEEALPESHRVIVVRNIGDPRWAAMEILPKAHSKWSGIEFVKKELGAVETIAVGDDENDIEMVRDADIGVAMSHAADFLMEVCDHQVDGPSGLAKYLKDYI